jgi:hypothetical protein
MKCYVLHASGNLTTSITAFPCRGSLSMVRLGMILVEPFIYLHILRY